MTLLQIKAKIYYYTGIYLAHKEENEYLQSKEFWKSFVKMAGNKKNDMSLRDIQGLLIGLWQAKNGLCRPWNIWTSWQRKITWRVKILWLKTKKQKYTEPKTAKK